jgi:hypothetical protein
MGVPVIEVLVSGPDASMQPSHDVVSELVHALQLANCI